MIQDFGFIPEFAGLSAACPLFSIFWPKVQQNWLVNFPFSHFSFRIIS